jgi:hypothetical protein
VHSIVDLNHSPDQLLHLLDLRENVFCCAELVATRMLQDVS